MSHLHVHVNTFLQYVDVQPNDGFGTLLPLETIELDIVFQPKKAREFSFELTCKSLINRYMYMYHRRSAFVSYCVLFNNTVMRSIKIGINCFFGWDFTT